MHEKQSIGRMSIQELRSEWEQSFFASEEILTHGRLGSFQEAANEESNFNDVDMDQQIEWVSRVREMFPDLGPKDAYRLAATEFTRFDGVLPIEAHSYDVQRG